jgi:hypothetical protein
MVCADLWCPDVAHAILWKNLPPQEWIIHQVFYSTVFHVPLQRWQNCPKLFHVLDVTLCFGDLGEPGQWTFATWNGSKKTTPQLTTSARHIRIFQLVSIQSHRSCFWCPRTRSSSSSLSTSLKFSLRGSSSPPPRKRRSLIMRLERSWHL